MIKKLQILLLFLFFVSCLYSQTADSIPLNKVPSQASTVPQPSLSDKNTGFIFKPTLGLGIGTLSIYGDLYTKNFQAPMIGRVVYELNLSQSITHYLQFNFYVLNGKLGANERNVNVNRNLNFQSQITTGGINLLYNFGNFLPVNRQASPFVSLGFEGLEFLSKTDLYDAHNNRYYYWSDNTIRNKSQTDPEAFKAIEIKRDYSYESDIRELNLDGFGKYPERSFAVPVGIGSIFKINEFWSAKFGVTMHFTFTDYIDGVTNNSVGDRKGNARNDNFMMSSFSLNYNFGVNKKESFKDEEKYNMEQVDYFALDKDDQDADGVIDMVDSCQGTPPGIEVDAKGCPLDGDKDGVPDYLDKELKSGIDAFVDENGVTLTDSIFAYRYEFYMDSTGRFAKVEVHDHKGNLVVNSATQKTYTVELGNYKKGLSSVVLSQFLSINDINSTVNNDSTTTYTAGTFSTVEAAEKRKQELINSGVTYAKVVYKQKGKVYDLADVTSNQNNTNKSGIVTTKDKTESTSNEPTNSVPASNIGIHSSDIVFRIQLGAYHKPISKNVFKDIENLMEVRTDDSLYKYMTGAYTDISIAAKNKVEILLKGYDGVFITAYKDGKRIMLKDAGATTNSEKETIDEIPDNKAISGVNKKLIQFKVQIGALIYEPTSDNKIKFAKIKNLEKEATTKGLNRYVVGPFNDYNTALNTKNNLMANGVTDAFIIAFFNGEQITTQEAIELLK
ncbi:MAG: hypothetical protein ABI315_14585 [Bacteroidia bacterium]